MIITCIYILSHLIDIQERHIMSPILQLSSQEIILKIVDSQFGEVVDGLVGIRI